MNSFAKKIVLLACLFCCNIVISQAQTCGTCGPSMIPNGGFESGGAACGPIDTPFTGTIACWTPITVHQGMYTTGCAYGPYNIPNSLTVPTTNIHAGSTGANNHFISMLSGLDTGTGNYFETALQEKLSAGLINGHTYNITFWAKSLSAANAIAPTGNLLGVSSHLEFCASSATIPLTTYGSSGFNASHHTWYPFPAGVETLTSINIPYDTTWHPYNIQFTYTGSSGDSNFILAPAPWLDPVYTTPPYENGFFIDDVSMIDNALDSTKFILPSNLQNCDSITDLSAYVSDNPTIDSFTGAGVINRSGTYVFVPGTSAYGPSTINVYYRISGCPQVLSSQIQLNGCCSPNVQVTVDTNHICLGGTATITAYNGDSYSWSPAAGVSCSTCTSVTVSPTQPTTYTVTGTNSSGCVSQSSITIYAFQVIASAVQDSICAGQYAYLNVSGSLNYEWEPVPTGSFCFTCTIAQLKPTTTTNFTVTATDNAGCQSFASVLITVIPLPVVGSIIGNDSVCVNDPYQYSDTTASGTWASSNNSIATIDATTGFVTGVTTGTVTITYSVYNLLGCPTTVTKDIYVKPSPSTSISAGGATSFCSGSNVSLSATGSGYTYQWQIGNSNISGAMGSTYSAVGSGSYNVVATGVNGCTTASNSISVSVDTVTASISGSPTTFCAGSSVTLNANTRTGYTYNYLWFKNGTSTGTTTSSYTVTTSTAAGHYGYTVSVTDAATGCSALSSVDSVIINASPSASISAGGSTTFCTGGSVTLTANPTSGVTYSWSPGGSTASSENISSSGSYSVTVTSTSTGCSSTSSTTTVTVNTYPTATITGSPTTFCAGGSVVLSANTGSGLSYLWSAGGTGSSITVSTSGSYTVEVTHSGCTTTSSATTVTVNSAPTVSITSSSTSLCSGSVTFTATGSGISSYQWKDGSSNVGTNSSSYTATTTGTYTVIATGSSGCTTTSNSIVITGTDPCNALCFFGGSSYDTLTGSVSSISSGNHYVTGTLHITTTTTVSSAYLFIASLGTIIVDAGATLTLSGCHLSSCPGSMWQGIELGTSSGIVLSDNTLIEDATYAVSVTDASQTFSSDGAIFNKNQTGLYVLSVSTPSGISVSNTVFTSRTLATSYSSWPAVSTLKTGTTPSGTDAHYVAPYDINTAGYSGVSLNVGGSPLYGILLSSVGVTSGSSTPSFTELQIGNTTSGNRNMFDNLEYGIYAANTNVSSVNNTFMNMSVDGIYGTVTTISGLQYYADMYARLQVYNGGGSSINEFYNCRSAVETNNYYEVTGTNALITSNHTTTVMTTGKNGYNIHCWKYANLNISDNTITNVENGVTIAAAFAMEPTPNPSLTASFDPLLFERMGSLYVRENVIQAITPGYSYSGAYVINAIQLLLATGDWTVSINDYFSPTHISSNTITDAYNGILANNVIGSVASNFNSISLASTSGTQFAIHHENCFFDTVFKNTSVTGTGSGNDNVRGTYSSANHGFYICCNSLTSFGRASDFDGAAGTGKWFNNTMLTYGKGFSLFTSIGQQGAADKPINDQWMGAGDDTYTGTGISPLSSILYVSGSGSPYVPTNNFNQISSPGNIYSTGNGISSASGTSDGCADADGTDIMLPPTNPFQGGVEAIVQNHLYFSDDNAAVENWMAQYGAFKFIQANPGLTSSSTILNDFYSQALTSRFGWLASIETNITQGYFDEVALLLTEGISPMCQTDTDSYGVIILDCSDANTIVTNYLNFYTAMNDYATGSLNGTDAVNITTLAYSCPNTNGMVVYQARTLYTLINNDAPAWDDESCESGLEGKQSNQQNPKPTPFAAITAGQQYTLSPNPGNGNITVFQKTIDKNPVKAQIWNAEGKSVYGNEVIFKNGTTQINEKGIAPGLYMLELQDNSCSIYTLKFVVE